MPELRKQMHQTTIRFDSELWGRIDTESRRIGVSAAQYIRDATLVRLTREADWALGLTGQPAVPFPVATAAISASDAIGTENVAVWAQARQARERARDLRESARRLAEALPQRRSADSGVEPSGTVQGES